MLAGAALLATTPGAFACGLEDPSSISLRRGALNVAFPEALHVGTAVWQAQLAGTLSRDPMLQRDDLAPEARDTLRLVKANALLRRLAGTFVAAPGGERPAVSASSATDSLPTRAAFTAATRAGSATKTSQASAASETGRKAIHHII